MKLFAQSLLTLVHGLAEDFSYLNIDQNSDLPYEIK